MGNCEESLGYGAADCGCGFTPGSQCDLLSNTWYPFANQRLDDDSRRWMRSLPRILLFRLAAYRLAVVHGSADLINRFLYPSMEDAAFAEQLDLLGVDIVLAGHSGLPFERQLAHQLWLNAGAIGLPANDGTRDGWYLLLEERDGEIHYRTERLSYDVEGAYAAMLREGLDNAYATALLEGLWPSIQVLPAAEATQTGIPLRPFAGTFALSKH